MCSRGRWISTSYAFSEDLSEYMYILTQYGRSMKHLKMFKDFQDEVENYCNKKIKKFMIES